MNFRVTEEDSDVTIAVISSLFHKPHPNSLKQIAAKIVKEEWVYDSVEVEDFQQTSELPQSYAIFFDCVTPDGDEEIRAVNLTPISVYHI